jgi:hypothetical protein
LERGESFSKLVGEWFVESDFSKFESTQQMDLLVHIELGVWKRLLNLDDYHIVERLFWLKMVKQGHCTHGVKFCFLFCRGSGDMDTGLFNTIINWIATRYFEDINGMFKGQFLVDGDDNVMKGPIGKTDYIDTFAQFGLEAKFLVRTNYHDVEFCSSKFIKYNRQGDMMQVQNLNKVLNNIGYMTNSEYSNCVGEYYYSLGFMYEKLYCNLPVYKELAKFMRRITSRSTHIAIELLKNVNPAYIDILKAEKNEFDCDPEFVLSEYFLGFNLSPVEIEKILEYLNTTAISLPLGRDKKFKKSGDFNLPLTNVDYLSCQETMENTLLSEPEEFFLLTDFLKTRKSHILYNEL